MIAAKMHGSCQIFWRGSTKLGGGSSCPGPPWLCGWHAPGAIHVLNSQGLAIDLRTNLNCVNRAPAYLICSFCVSACPEGTYKNFTAPGDKSTCLPCPDSHQTSPEGSTSEHQCRCMRGYRPDGPHHCTGDHPQSSSFYRSISAARRRPASFRRKRSLRRRCK